MSTYRVLALDGGGIRGLATTILLQRLCGEPGLEHAFDDIDLIAGNSSGALIALAMAHGLAQSTVPLTLARTREVFENGQRIFGPKGRWYTFPYWLTAKYGTEAREKGLKTLLGEHTTLRDLHHHVLISAFDLDNHGRKDGGRGPAARMWKPKLFHNFPGENSDEDMLAWKVALYSTAAPAYFPTADGYIDGGVFANNPAMCALAQVFDRRYAPDPKPPLADVLVLSIGAAQNLMFLGRKPLRWAARFLNRTPCKWGALLWASPYASLTRDGTVDVASYECQQMLGPNFRRLAPAVPAGARIDLDDTNALDELIELARNAPIDEAATWLKERWMPGLQRRPRRPSTVGQATSKHIGSSTELTCVMPIKQGFVSVLDTRTYATRLRIVFKVLQRLRAVARERCTRRPVLDIVDAASAVHAFSWTILGERQLLLNVVFDRPWEPYIRVIWRDLGALIDLFLCNCEGYPSSTAGFDAFAAFVRQHQTDTAFFYSESGVSVEDERYLVEAEKRQRLAGARLDTSSGLLLVDGPELTTKADQQQDQADAKEAWLTVLQALYGLRSVYPDDSPDHVFLKAAASTLLENSRPEGLGESAELDWYFAATAARTERPIEAHEIRKIEPSEVQGGILQPYRHVSHGCLLLATVTDPLKARAFLGRYVDSITTDAEQQRHEAEKRRKKERSETLQETFRNIAFTCSGLRQLGVKESVLAKFPKEFREGMEGRAGLLGDVRENHPDHWNLPEWNVHFRDDEMRTVDIHVADGGARSQTELSALVSSFRICLWPAHQAQTADRSRACGCRL